MIGNDTSPSFRQDQPQLFVEGSKVHNRRPGQQVRLFGSRSVGGSVAQIIRNRSPEVVELPTSSVGNATMCQWSQFDEIPADHDAGSAGLKEFRSSLSSGGPFLIQCSDIYPAEQKNHRLVDEA